ncbi:MAG: tetratricopeptide repeat protein [Ignavibacteria bacterium]|nr:tetratricopeptide repeat protein [Ignavibacteria bacterium]
MNRTIFCLLYFINFFLLTYAQDYPVHPKAVELFIEGKTYELQDNYLAAINKYQEALKIDESPGIYYALSRLYSNVSQHTKALEYILLALKIQPDNLLYKEHAADTYILIGDYPKALEHLKEISLKKPDDINILYNIGRMYEALKQPSEALKYYENITENYQYEETVLMRMADIYESFGDYMNTAATIEKMLTLNPTDLQLRYSAAAAYIKIPDYDKAIRIYEEILKTDPNNNEVQTEIMKLYFRSHRNKEAFEKYSKLIEKDTLDFISKMNIAIAFFQASSEDKEALGVSKSILQTLKEAYPDQWMPVFYLAYIDSRQDKEKSEKIFKELLQKNDTSAELYVQVGFYYYEQNRFQQAVEIFSEGADRFRNDFRLNYLTGNTFYRSGRNREALPYLERAMEISPSDLNVLSNLGLVYDDLKMYDECDRLYEHAFKYHPDNNLLLNNYAYHLAERGERLKEAEEMSRKTIEREPENASYLDTYGWILFKMKDYKNALKYIDKAVKLSRNETLLDHLGDVYEALGEIVKALKAWKEALQLNPENESIKNKIKKYN